MSQPPWPPESLRGPQRHASNLFGNHEGAKHRFFSPRSEIAPVVPHVRSKLKSPRGPAEKSWRALRPEPWPEGQQSLLCLKGHFRRDEGRNHTTQIYPERLKAELCCHKSLMLVCVLFITAHQSLIAKIRRQEQVTSRSSVFSPDVQELNVRENGADPL